MEKLYFPYKSHNFYWFSELSICCKIALHLFLRTLTASKKSSSALSAPVDSMVTGTHDLH